MKNQNETRGGQLPEEVKCKVVGSGGWLGGSAHDFPCDADLENGCYQNKCLGCGVLFIGHKRRNFCRVCDNASKARWESLTPEQRAAEERQAAAEVAAWVERNRTSPNYGVGGGSSERIYADAGKLARAALRSL